MRVPFDEIHDTLRRSASSRPAWGGGPRADLSARNSSLRGLQRDGVRPSHGLNRFPRFMRMIRRERRGGRPRVQEPASPRTARSSGWDGRGGPWAKPQRARDDDATIALATARTAPAAWRSRIRAPPDAGRQLRLAGGRRRGDRDLLDQHARPTCRPGGRPIPASATTRSSSPVPRRAGTTWCTRHGDVAVLGQRPGVLSVARRVAARPGRLRRGRRAQPRSGRRRGASGAPATRRILERDRGCR